MCTVLRELSLRGFGKSVSFSDSFITYNKNCRTPEGLGPKCKRRRTMGDDFCKSMTCPTLDEGTMDKRVPLCLFWNKSGDASQWYRHQRSAQRKLAGSQGQHSTKAPTQSSIPRHTHTHRHTQAEPSSFASKNQEHLQALENSTLNLLHMCNTLFHTKLPANVSHSFDQLLQNSTRICLLWVGVGFRLAGFQRPTWSCPFSGLEAGRLQ